MDCDECGNDIPPESVEAFHLARNQDLIGNPGGPGRRPRFVPSYSFCSWGCLFSWVDDASVRDGPPQKTAAAPPA